MPGSQYIALCYQKVLNITSSLFPDVLRSSHFGNTGPWPLVHISSEWLNSAQVKLQLAEMALHSVAVFVCLILLPSFFLLRLLTCFLSHLASFFLEGLLAFSEIQNTIRISNIYCWMLHCSDWSSIRAVSNHTHLLALLMCLAGLPVVCEQVSPSRWGPVPWEKAGCRAAGRGHRWGGGVSSNINKHMEHTHGAMELHGDSTASNRHIK